METKIEQTNEQNKVVRALLKEPDKPPRLIDVSFDLPKRISRENALETVKDIINPDSVYPIMEQEYNKKITLYMGERGTYNFSIGWQFVLGSVLFMRTRNFNNSVTFCPSDLTDMEIKRICAAFGWKLQEGDKDNA